MASQAHRRRYCYVEVYTPWEWPFGHLGKDWFGLIVGRWPLLAFFRDHTFYYNVATYGISIGPWLDIGLFIDFRSRDEIMKDNVNPRHAAEHKCSEKGKRDE